MHTHRELPSQQDCQPLDTKVVGSTWIRSAPRASFEATHRKARWWRGSNLMKSYTLHPTAAWHLGGAEQRVVM